MLACGGRPPPASSGDVPPPAYGLVVLTTGPATDLDDDAKRTAFAGHFRNMGELADQGRLLLAGPFREPLAAPDRRGLFVLATSDVDEALRVAGTDPAVQAGVFAVSAVQLLTRAPLHDILAADQAARVAHGATVGEPDIANLRSYVLATAPFEDEREAWAEAASGVLMVARTHEPGGTDELLLWLDAEDEASAAPLLSAAPDPSAWTLHGWFGTKSIASLGRSAPSR